MDSDLPIPRIVHWVWLGVDPVSEIFAHYTDSWKRHHPNWEMRLWRDGALPELACQAEYDRTPGFKTRYDIVRLEILRQFGGVIVDLDIEAIRPLDPLLKGVRAFVGRIGERHIGNQVLGAVPRHPFFERAVAALRASADGPTASSEIAGKEFLKRLLAAHPDGVKVFPSETFYFQPSFAPPRKPDAFPQVYAVHHELASYVSPLPAETIELRLGKLLQQVARLEAEVPRESGPRLEDIRARLSRAERRVKRAIAVQQQGYEAKLRRAEAAREQAEARLREVLARHSGKPSD